MSTADQRLAVIHENYMSASQNEPHDLARALTAADVTAIQANVADARQIYYAAAAEALTKAGADVEAAYDAAKSAQESVAEARRGSEAIARFLGRLTDASKTAKDLANLAKKV